MKVAKRADKENKVKKSRMKSPGEAFLYHHVKNKSQNNLNIDILGPSKTFDNRLNICSPNNLIEQSQPKAPWYPGLIKPQQTFDSSRNSLSRTEFLHKR